MKSRQAAEVRMQKGFLRCRENSRDVSGEDDSESGSAKALKSYVELIVAGGELNLDSLDDGIHSNQDVTVHGGTILISAGDDGIHADKTLTVNGGSLDIEKSYEGLEGFDIVINDGSIKIVSSDDGINAAGKDDGEIEPENQKNQPFMADEDQGASMTINGGVVYVNANGDGLDANGDIFMNGGMVTVHGLRYWYGRYDYRNRKYRNGTESERGFHAGFCSVLYGRRD